MSNGLSATRATLVCHACRRGKDCESLRASLLFISFSDMNRGEKEKKQPIIEHYSNFGFLFIYYLHIKGKQYLLPNCPNLLTSTSTVLQLLFLFVWIICIPRVGFSSFFLSYFRSQMALAHILSVYQSQQAVHSIRPWFIRVLRSWLQKSTQTVLTWQWRIAGWTGATCSAYTHPITPSQLLLQATET